MARRQPSTDLQVRGRDERPDAARAVVWTRRRADMGDTGSDVQVRAHNKFRWPPDLSPRRIPLQNLVAHKCRASERRSSPAGPDLTSPDGLSTAGGQEASQSVFTSPDLLQIFQTLHHIEILNIANDPCME